MMNLAKGPLFKKIFFTIVIVTILSASSVIAVNAETMPSSSYSGHGGQAYNGKHGNFTSDGLTRGSFPHTGNFTHAMGAFNMTSHSGSFTRNGTIPMNSINHTGTESVNQINSQPIPSWIKTNAKWWAEGQVGDADFIQGLQYLIQNGMVKVPITQVNSTTAQPIPQWVKNAANWWAAGQVSDSEFIQTIQYLISADIIKA